MQSVIVAWCRTNEKDFEDFIPLRFVGRRNKKLGYSNNINVLFLDGFERLSQEYRDSLKSLGFILHDVSKMFSEVKKKYSKLDDFSIDINGFKKSFSEYERNTLLKWIVVGKFFAGESLVHFDGDIVFNEDPAIIAEKVEGKTFILQGCPAFSAISDYKWFDQYEEQLGLYINDIDGYAQKALEEREGWEVTFKTRWAGSRFGKIMWHDQDLQSHLIHTGRLIQDSVESVLFDFQDYLLFENSLFFHSYDDGFPYKYSREDGVDYFEYIRKDAQDSHYKKRILFWHMQSCFNFYLSKFIFRKKYLKFVPMGRLEFNGSAKGFEDTINKRLSRFLKHTSRINVYKYFFQDHDFSGVFKDSVWWKKGVFR